jgi:hypothetical protein
MSIPQVVNIGTSFYGASAGWKYRQPLEIETAIDERFGGDARREKLRLLLIRHSKPQGCCMVRSW